MPAVKAMFPGVRAKKMAAALGWSEDQINFLLYPLAEGKEPIFSMGDDTPPAFLSRMRRHPLGLLQATLRPGDKSSD